MSLLSELKDLATECGLPVETGVFSGTAPEAYLVLTPLSDTFDLFGTTRQRSTSRRCGFPCLPKAAIRK